MSQRRMVLAHTARGRPAADTDSVAKKDSINNTSELVEAGAYVRIEAWRTLVMSCHGLS